MGGVKVVASVAVGAGVGVNAMDAIADVLTEAARAEAAAAAENDAARDGSGDAEVAVAAATTREESPAGATAAEPSAAKETTSAAAEQACEADAKCNGVATPDSSAAQDENDRVRKRKAKAAAPCHFANGKRVVSNGKRPTAEENGAPQEKTPRSTAPSGEVIDLEAEVDTESDSVAVAPVMMPCAVDAGPNDDLKKRSRSPDAAKDDDDELVGVTSVEDPHSPEVICLDSDDKDDTQEEEEEGASEVGVVEGGPGRPYHRRKKRGRAFGFSNNRSRKENKLKRQSLAIVASDAAADDSSHMVPAPSKGRGRPRRQQSGDAVPGDPNVSTVQPATNSSDAVAWNWDSCRDYFEPLTQSNMNELANVRRDFARVVAANSHTWGSIRRLEHDDAYLASLATDTGEDVDRLRIRTTRRGRSFRDAWEEEDFVTNQLRASRTGKKRPFAGCETITSNRDLVHGYDDELFRAYTKLLEARVGRQESPKNLPDTNGVAEQPQRIETPPKRRLKTAKRRPVETDKSTLPAVPVHHIHPASFGAWKLKGKETPSFDVLHPASIRSTKTPQRWVEEFVREEVHTNEVSSSGPRRSGRHEAKANDDIVVGDQEDEDEGETEIKFGDDESMHDEAIQLPSFGVVLEEDEISREITNSLMRLVEVSALNWRRTQTLYERAVSYIEVTPLLQAEEAASQRLEHLYRTLYPPSANPDEEVDDYEREFKLWRRPKDLLSFVSRSSSVVTESLAIRGALEYAWRLKIGDSIDVLDRNGCWNDGVVIDIYADAGGEIKNVLVCFALWGADSTEWVPVVEARILPRGVADGRVSFTLGPSRTRKRHVELNKEVADFLQRSYPTRQKSQLQIFLSGIDNDPDSDSTTKPSKKQRRK